MLKINKKIPDKVGAKMAMRFLPYVAGVIGFVALILIAGPLALKYSMQKGDHYFSQGVYDLKSAKRWYKIASSVASNYGPVHFQLGRIDFVSGDFKSAEAEFTLALNESPKNDRAYYMRGLARGYENDFSGSQADFEAFLQKAPHEWAAYNDLAWAYFQDKQYEKAKVIAEKGNELFPDNAWILNGLGSTYAALGEKDKADEALNKALALGDKLTSEDWKLSYPSNDPAQAPSQLALFKSDISSNIGNSQVGKKDDLKFASACNATTVKVCNGNTCSTPVTCEVDGGYHDPNLNYYYVYRDYYGGMPWFQSILGSYAYTGAATQCADVPGQCSVNTDCCPAACGGANGAVTSTVPTGGMCALGSVTNFVGSDGQPANALNGPWRWTCQGPSASCQASCSTTWPVVSVDIKIIGCGKVSRKLNAEGSAGWVDKCGSVSGLACQNPGYSTTCTIGLWQDRSYDFQGTETNSYGTFKSWTVPGIGESTENPLNNVVISSSLNGKTIVADFGGPRNGQCGPANGASYIKGSSNPKPEDNKLCSVGTPSPYPINHIFDNSWNWVCLGNNGGNTTNPGCSATENVPKPGVCGTSNNKYFVSIPTSNLCDSGELLGSVNGSGPWTWTCKGTYGHPTSANCSAKKGKEVIDWKEIAP